MRKDLITEGYGFTMLELLVVLAIFAILAAAVYFLLDPFELAKRGRDAGDRIIDLSNLKQAINVATTEATSSAAEVLCNGTTPPCYGSSNADGRSSDGAGWVKVNLTLQKAVLMPTLPVDPVNNSTYHYTYCSDGKSWEIATTLESKQQADKMKSDGGNDDNLYEVGTNLKLIAHSGGTCEY